MTTTNRGNEYWTPTPLLQGETVFLLGGGPSLTQQTVDRLRGRQVIAVNTSCRLAPWARFLYFTDLNWFDDHRADVEAWPGTVITSCKRAKELLPDKLLRVSLIHHPTFTIGEAILKFGRSSGHTAISVAIAMGAARVILLGYDMRLVGGRSHWHNEYPSQDAKLFTEDFLVHFTGWREAAVRAGVRVLNCTPDSALNEFDRAELDDVLAGEVW